MSETVQEQPVVVEKKRGKVAQFFVNMANNLGIVGQFMKFLWARKLWWMIPMVIVLLLFGFLLIFANASGIAPFIYTLF